METKTLTPVPPNGIFTICLEVCANCRDHRWCTRHVEEKYKQFSDDVRNAILQECPQGVVVEPFKPNDKPRIGAFEVTHGRNVLFSKLRTGLWPHPKAVATNVRGYIEAVRAGTDPLKFLVPEKNPVPPPEPSPAMMKSTFKSKEESKTGGKEPTIQRARSTSPGFSKTASKFPQMRLHSPQPAKQIPAQPSSKVLVPPAAQGQSQRQQQPPQSAKQTQRPPSQKPLTLNTNTNTNTSNKPSGPPSPPKQPSPRPLVRQLNKKEAVMATIIDERREDSHRTKGAGNTNIYIMNAVGLAIKNVVDKDEVFANIFVGEFSAGQTPYLFAGPNAIWGYHLMTDMVQDKTQSLTVDIIIRRKTGQEEVYGTATVGLGSCFEKPGSWTINKDLELKDKATKAAVPGKITFLISHLAKASDNIETLPTSKVEGKLSVNVVKANLISENATKAAAAVSISYGSIKLGKTVVIKSATPEWKETLKGEISADQWSKPAPLEAHIFDREGAFHEDYMGIVTIDITDCLFNPNTWVLNKEYPIEIPNHPEQHGKLGSITLQVGFFPKT